ncbi:MAG: hypothetical protein KKD69_01965 [Euryarchaeota archaeon]|nr:hypothetical protein [Euryarchaeota archaeon]
MFLIQILKEKFEEIRYSIQIRMEADPALAKASCFLLTFIFLRNGTGKSLLYVEFAVSEIERE